MNKYDWLELGMRLLGVYLVVQGVIGATGAAMTSAVADFEQLTTVSIASALVASFAGTCLVLLAPGFVGWLRGKDELALRAGRAVEADLP